MSHTISSRHHVAVAEGFYWQPINEHTPRGVKLQLLGQGGVAIYGQYDGKAKFFTHWAPLPKRRELDETTSNQDEDEARRYASGGEGFGP